MSDLEWSKAKACESGACIEAAGIADVVFIREGATPDIQLITSRANFAAFVAGAKAGDFDHLTEGPES